MAVLRDRPYGAFNFLVDLGSGGTEPSAGFAEVSGFGQEVDVVEYRNGNDRDARKLPGRSHVGNVALRRGITGSLDLYQWFNEVRNGNPNVRRSVVIALLDEEFQPVMRWLLRNAFPVKLDGPVLNAKSSDVAIEELVLACERIEIE